jgi:membrane protein implicated in regulation of membrane protease activity
MENAAALFGLAAVVSSIALVVHVIAAVWLRAREAERAQRSPDADTARMIAALQEQVARVESALEAQAVDIERLGEVQRFAARMLAERAPAGADSGSTARVSGRVVTPH